jgi:hypothetical protein
MLGTFSPTPSNANLVLCYFLFFLDLFFSRGAARALQEGNDIDTLILE